MSMAHGVEARVPFLDYKLLEFALGSPESFRRRDGIGKEPVKRYLAEFVGRESVYTPKRGFGVPIQEWFQGCLGDQLRDLLVTHREFVERYFDSSVLIAQSRSEFMRVRDAFQLWVVFVLLFWYDGHIA